MANARRTDSATALANPAPPGAQDLASFQKRRLPRQSRSRLTVESIKQATLALAAEKGFRSLTTEQIAERAGVNIGSLYQYFPNREAILLAIHEEVSSDLSDSVRLVNADVFDAPIEKAAFLGFERLFSIIERNQLILLHLVEQMPELKTAAQSASFANLHRGSIRNFIRHRLPQASPAEIDRRTFFVQNIALGCITRYLLDRPEGMSKKAFLKELTGLLATYVSQPG